MELDKSLIFEHLFTESSDGIFVSDISGNLVMVNNRVSELLNYNEADWKNIDYHKILGDEKDYQYITNSITNQTPIDNYEVRLITKDDKEVNCLITMQFIQNPSDQKDFVLCKIRDIVSLKQLEEQIDIKQRMNILGTLAGGIAHDFNNLFMGIAGNLSLVLMDTANLSKTHASYLNEAQKVIYQASSLIKQFQILSADSAGVLTNIDFYTIANDSFSFLQKATNRLIEKRINLSPNLYYVLADRIKINQVLLNLATFSITTIEERGAKKNDFIAISADMASDEDIKSRDIQNEEFVHITFEDSGPGLSEEARKQIFHPFYTVHEKNKFGRGLSLSVVYDIVTRQTNGYIDVESKEGEGTRFHIFIPKGDPKVRRVKKEYFVPVTEATETVLIADDEPSVRHVLTAALRRMGYIVHTASDGEECIAKYEKMKDKIDIIILDLTMPKMSGEQAFEKLLDINPDVNVIISSGHTEEEIRRGILSKADGFLTKPYNPNKLGYAIRQLFELRKKNQ
ncbi:MAG: hybrid sensor histidine kinase/response regulator [Candidatus Kariarchaeaceae archaeon]|jgi:PAS domain S-box-containing protein